MEDFRVLTEDEFEKLSSSERRRYTKQLKEYNSQKLVGDVVNQDEEESPKTHITTNTSKERKKVKGKVGRPKIENPNEKKQQITLTIEPETKEKLESVNPKLFKKLLGRYVDKNIEEIVDAIKKL